MEKLCSDLHMIKRVQIALAVLLVALVSVIVWQVLHPQEREPVYQGKRLSVWLALLYNDKASGAFYGQDEQAIRHIGANALPVLIGRLHAQDTRLKQLMMAWAEKQKLVPFHFNSADRRRIEALYGYGALGPLASAQVPSLIDTLSNDPSPRVRVAAAGALGYIGPEARLAAPALCRATKHPDRYVRQQAFGALSRILPDPHLTIPVLVAGLDDPNPSARWNAAIALVKYGPEARDAVTALLGMLATNGTAGFALDQIDPEAVVKARPK